MATPQHRGPEARSLSLQEAEGHGWKVKKGKVYFKALCTCGKGHAKWSIHLTPSNPNYAKDLQAWFRRQECW